MILPIYAAVEFSLNHAIELDPHGKELLTQFHDKVIKLDISKPEITIYVLAKANNFQLLENFEGDIDTTIRARLIDLAQLSLMSKKEKNQAVFQGRIKIEGNITLGQQFQSLFSKLDIDWEEHLSHITGDIIAHQLFSSGKKLLSWSENSKKTLLANTTEFLQYETRDLIEKRETAILLNQIDEIRNAVDRLEARIKRLETFFRKNENI